eukprot:7376077-Prymnesium_polylepis.3
MRCGVSGERGPETGPCAQCCSDVMCAHVCTCVWVRSWLCALCMCRLGRAPFYESRPDSLHSGVACAQCTAMLGSERGSG